MVVDVLIQHDNDDFIMVRSEMGCESYAGLPLLGVKASHGEKIGPTVQRERVHIGSSPFNFQCRWLCG